MPKTNAAKGLPTRPRKALKSKNKIPRQPRPGEGRPPIYDAPSHCELATNLTLLGMTEVEIATAFQISEITLFQWKRAHPEFASALHAGGAVADGKVALSLYKRATGQASRVAHKIFLPAGGTSEADLIYAPYAETSFADVGAAKLWLTNRQPNRWRERREVEVTGGLEHKISLMTPEERRARLIELQAKAAEVIEGEAVEVPGEE